MELAPGDRLGPYAVLTPLGAGGMGQVWKARDTRLGREVAIKIIAPDKSGDTGLQSRFEREARALSALNHPHIVTVYDVGEKHGAQYIVSELVQGESLRKLISQGPLPTDRLLQTAGQIMSALVAAHAAGIVHRDLKPENIMITADGNVKILDFGLARRIQQHVSDGGTTLTQTTATQSGVVLGTAGYMSPEQICGEEVDGRSDIFSVGVVLYEMASGARAFRGRTSIEMMSAVLKDDPAPLRTKSSGALDHIVCRCLQKDPAKRFQSAVELRAALDGVHGGAPGKRKVWTAGAAAVVVLAGGGIYWRTWRIPSPPPVATPQIDTRPAVLPPTPAPPPKPTPAAPKSTPAVKVGAGYQQAYEEGMVLLSERKWPDAAARLSDAIRANPNAGLAYLGRCRAEMAQQDHANAIDDCTQVIRQLPNSADAYHERGTAYRLSQQFDKSVEDMNAAIRLGDADMAVAYSVRGRAHGGLKEWGDAISDYDQAIKLNPQSPHFYVYRGTAWNARSQFRKAIDDFTEAIRLQPNLPNAYIQRAIARQRTGDLTGAAADRNQAKGLRK